MPLARIITRNPQTTIAASEYLRSQGYVVETVSPEEFRVTPAELELHLKKCGPEEALAHAKALLESPQSAAPAETSEVSVERPEKVKVPVAYDIAGRPVEFVEEEETVPERRQRANRFASALVAMFARGKRGISSGFTGARESARRPVAEFQRDRAEQRALKLEAELALEREEVRQEEELARERLRQRMERQRQEAELAERQRQERIAAEREAEEHRIAAERAASEERERQRIEAERAAALAAEERARIEAERQAAASHAQQEATMAAEREAAPEEPTRNIPAEMAAQIASASPGAVSPQAVEPALPKKPAASDHAARRRPSARSAQRVQPFLSRRPRTPIAISRKAVATAVGAGILVLLGFVAYANRRPASPFSPGALMKNQSVTQETPFGAATITPAPAASKPNAAAVTPAKTSPAVRSTAQKPRSTQRSARRLRPSSEGASVAKK